MIVNSYVIHIPRSDFIVWEDNNMEIRHLKYFATVANYGNITRAAEELKISQPPLSQQIQALEEKVGFKLFVRHKKGMRLTEEGALLLQRIQPLLKQFEELSNYIQGIQESTFGNFTIATIPAFSGLLSKSLFYIWDKHPNVHVSIREGYSHMVISLVRNREAHIGITRLPILSPELNFSILGDDPVRVFLREDDPLAKKERILPKDLENRKLLLLRSSVESGFSQIVRTLEETGKEPQIIGHSESIFTLLQMTKRGPGICIVPNSSITLAPAGLKAIPFGITDINIPSAVVWLKSETNPFVYRIRDLIISTLRSSNKLPKNS